ncbi:hypothetical protein BUE80_DR003541 [Diplocarpon rosae]|nr:hypothetical protein BUE80_DR003541 [Diplocarpon rosae]
MAGMDSVSENDSHVMVIGAGPAGLMLASNLVRYGIKTTIVDDRADKTSTGRADGLQPKTIETLKQLGLAGPLLQKGAKIYDICFWNGTPSHPLRRVGREVHYPPGIVDVQDPFILLVHQGMVENIFLDDLALRGVAVIRNSPFSRYRETKCGVEVACEDHSSKKPKIFTSKYVVGCDGAHSKVRKSLSDAPYQGERSNSTWGVLDGVIETDFPDLWSKAVITSETEGSILCIPREKNMTRLYIELHPGSAPVDSEAATEEFVMQRAKAIMHPFKVSWGAVEWFGIYRVGQRVAKKFSSESEKVFIAGDWRPNSPRRELRTKHPLHLRRRRRILGERPQPPGEDPPGRLATRRSDGPRETDAVHRRQPHGVCGGILGEDGARTRDDGGGGVVCGAGTAGDGDGLLSPAAALRACVAAGDLRHRDDDAEGARGDRGSAVAAAEEQVDVLPG